MSGAIAAPAFDPCSHTSLVRRGFHPDPQGWLPTGLAPLDACLPGGGLPEGHLVELVGRRAAGKLSLALAVAAGVLARGEPAALLDPTATIVPDVWSSPVLQRLLVVRGGGTVAALRAADALLRTGAFALLVLDVPGRAAPPVPALVRLARDARDARAPLVLVTEWLPWRTNGLASPVSLRLEVRRRGTDHEVRLAKSRFGGEGASVRVALPGGAGASA